nr:SPRY domain-containing SOCS box protein 4-like [Oncorhynchus nerka]
MNIFDAKSNCFGLFKEGTWSRESFVDRQARLLATLEPEPLPLMDLCRRVARLALGRDRVNQIDTLPLPETIKNYLQYQ